LQLREGRLVDLGCEAVVLLRLVGVVAQCCGQLERFENVVVDLPKHGILIEREPRVRKCRIDHDPRRFKSIRRDARAREQAEIERCQRRHVAFRMLVIAADDVAKPLAARGGQAEFLAPAFCHAKLPGKRHQGKWRDIEILAEVDVDLVPCRDRGECADGRIVIQ